MVVSGRDVGDVTREEKKVDPVATGSRVDAQVIRASRVYEASADYDALLGEFARTINVNAKAAEVVRAKLDVEIAKDMAANILSLRNATERGAAEANALSRRVYWLNWILVLVGVAGIVAAWWFWAHPNP